MVAQRPILACVGSLQAITRAKRPLFTIALIAGDVVMIDMMHKAGLLDKVKIV
jgi:hypothetical protein